ncbi:NAD(P)-dependent alcohol dehydrogenase [Streptomyces sp. WMMC940]|uniref:NAD(P)-dependent alcohol dehydrogenase n=1 Tax=Streptomyces sp. WMMC940 TaxID=3015153 RepID=UPI0022B6B631|nr:NAD(P)-dependent alcohol dehydrogenase [Streptomyces sp. WMMC940]MCZ7462365.1 NAD(P)-dependent alcohol dehydrogenase [Streptomyces sp. WMMC940]
MKAVVHRAFGAPEVLSVEEVPKPTPKAGELLIRIRAAALTAVDCAARQGRPFSARLAFGPFSPRNPVLGGACAGDVEVVGTGVRRFAIGDRVVAISGSFGMHAEYVCVREDSAVTAMSSGLTHAEAVAVSEGALTALPFLRDAANLRAGQSILVNGASGSVGTAAVQLAQHLGAEVTGVCSTANIELVRSLGAHEIIDYTKEGFARNRRTYDVIFDAVGKSSFAYCRGALKRGGIYLTTAPSMAILGQTLWTKLRSKKARIEFTGLRPPREKTKDLVLLGELAGAGAIRAVIDRTYPLEQAAEAHGYVDTGRKRGAVIMLAGGPG